MLRTTSSLSRLAAAFAAATVLAACGSNSPSTPSSGGHPTQAQLQQAQQDAVRFANCMRSHGVPDFPDPTTSPIAYKSALEENLRSPAGQAAVTACQHLMPGGRVVPGNQRAPNSPAQTAAFLAFAHCLRRHGFSNFPDPNSSGQITHEMLANDGINLRQPGLLEAADACVSVTHGLLTKADVAHFAAGQ
jgi:hypothetical protein